MRVEVAAAAWAGLEPTLSAGADTFSTWLPSRRSPSLYLSPVEDGRGCGSLRSHLFPSVNCYLPVNYSRGAKATPRAADTPKGP